MTLTERVNAAEDRYAAIRDAHRLKDDGTPSEFYLALPMSSRWCSRLGRWEVVYAVGLPNPQGGSRRIMEVYMGGTSPSSYCVVGEEAAEDFVYMMNMARINRKDGA